MDPLDYGGLRWAGGRKHPYIETDNTGSQALNQDAVGFKARGFTFDVVDADFTPNTNYTNFKLVARGKTEDGTVVRASVIYSPDDASVFLPLEVDLSGMTNLVRFNLKGRVEPDTTGELNAIRDFGLDNLLLDIDDGAARVTDWQT